MYLLFTNLFKLGLTASRQNHTSLFYKDGTQISMHSNAKENGKGEYKLANI